METVFIPFHFFPPLSSQQTSLQVLNGEVTTRSHHTETRRLAPPAPGDVGFDEEGAPEAPEHSQQDERDELKQVPWRVVLHVEQHQAAVPKRVNGAKHEGRHQGGKERAPQRL